MSEYLKNNVDVDIIEPHKQQNCYDGGPCIDGKSGACSICYIPLQRGERICCKLKEICKFTISDCFVYNPDFKCNFDTRTHSNIPEPFASYIRGYETGRKEECKQVLEKMNDIIYTIEENGEELSYESIMHEMESLR